MYEMEAVVILTSCWCVEVDLVEMETHKDLVSFSLEGISSMGHVE